MYINTQAIHGGTSSAHLIIARNDVLRHVIEIEGIRENENT